MAGAKALLHPGDVVGGNYILDTVVDHGDGCTLFAARHRRTGRRLAIRWLEGADIEAIHAFLRRNGQTTVRSVFKVHKPGGAS